MDRSFVLYAPPAAPKHCTAPMQLQCSRRAAIPIKGVIKRYSPYQIGSECLIVPDTCRRIWVAPAVASHAIGFAEPSEALPQTIEVGGSAGVIVRAGSSS